MAAVSAPAQGLESCADPSWPGIDAVGDDNPLPHALVVAPAGDELALAGWLRELPEADLVQHDAQWRQRLDTWLRFGTRVAWVLAALFGLGVLLVVGNTVRLDIQSRRGEIGVLQLLGATDGFIRRPSSTGRGTAGRRGSRRCWRWPARRWPARSRNWPPATAAASRSPASTCSGRSRSWPGRPRWAGLAPAW